MTLLISLFAPLISSLSLLALRGRLPRPVAGWIATLSVFLGFGCALFGLLTLPGTTIIPLMHWFEIGGIRADFSLYLDPLSLWMSTMVTGVGALIHLYSIGYMSEDARFTSFFAYLNLFIFFMLALVLSDSYLGMFIGWEGVGLCSYLLIGFWYQTPAYNQAAQKAFVMNRIGDLGFLVAVMTMMWVWGTSSFLGVLGHLDGVALPLLLLIGLGLVVGVTGKSAQIPLFTWLPDAMAGPTPVSALIHAATMVTAGVYLIARSTALFSLLPGVQALILWIGVATAVVGAFIALTQRDIKKILAYSTMSQLGFMVAALGLGATHAALFHMSTHAFFKALLFLGAGNVIHALSGEQDVFKMGGLRKSLPYTFWIFVVGTLAISGCPPFSGFYSKDAILLAAHAGNTLAFTLLGITSLLTAFYMFRLFFLVFFRSSNPDHHPHEGHWTMQVPLGVLAILSAVAGVAYGHHGPESAYASTLLTLTGLGLGGAIGLAYWLYGRDAAPNFKLWGVTTLSSRKLFVDELYDSVMVRPYLWMCRLFSQGVESGLALAYDGMAGVTTLLAVPVQTLQNGNLSVYFFILIVGVVVILGWVR